MMLALIAALALGSPAAAPAPVCRWYSRTEQRCRDSDVEYLGAWDPRPLDWSSYNGQSVPDSWPSYPLEKRVAAGQDQ